MQKINKKKKAKKNLRIKINLEKNKKGSLDPDQEINRRSKEADLNQIPTQHRRIKARPKRTKKIKKTKRKRRRKIKRKKSQKREIVLNKKKKIRKSRKKKTSKNKNKRRNKNTKNVRNNIR